MDINTKKCQSLSSRPSPYHSYGKTTTRERGGMGGKKRGHKGKDRGRREKQEITILTLEKLLDLL